MAGLRERKKQATRAAIRDAAMRLFDEQGFSGTTIDQIAADAEVSRATVLNYFATKEDIVFGDAPAAVDSLRDWPRSVPGCSRSSSSAAGSSPSSSSSSGSRARRRPSPPGASPSTRTWRR
jgi:hypothetical protein